MYVYGRERDGRLAGHLDFPRLWLLSFKWVEFLDPHGFISRFRGQVIDGFLGRSITPFPSSYNDRFHFAFDLNRWWWWRGLGLPERIRQTGRWRIRFLRLSLRIRGEGKKRTAQKNERRQKVPHVISHNHSLGNFLGKEQTNFFTFKLSVLPEGKFMKE